MCDKFDYGKLNYESVYQFIRLRYNDVILIPWEELNINEQEAYNFGAMAVKTTYFNKSILGMGSDNELSPSESPREKHRQIIKKNTNDKFNKTPEGFLQLMTFRKLNTDSIGASTRNSIDSDIKPSIILK